MYVYIYTHTEHTHVSIYLPLLCSLNNTWHEYIRNFLCLAFAIRSISPDVITNDIPTCYPFIRYCLKILSDPKRILCFFQCPAHNQKKLPIDRTANELVCILKVTQRILCMCAR